MNKKLKTSIKLAIGIFIIGLLIKEVGTTNILTELKNTNPWYFLPYILIMIGTMILGAININILLKPIHKKIPTKKVIKYTLISWVLGMISPGKIGEFAIIRSIKKKENIEYGESLPVLIIDKLITALTLTPLAILGIIVIQGNTQTLWWTAIIILLTILGTTTILNERIRNLIKKYIIKDKAVKFKNFSTNFKKILKNKEAITINTTLTLVKWILNFASFYFILAAFGIQVELLPLLAIMAVTQIIALIPISISGLGLREASGAYLLTTLGISLSIGTTAFIITTIINYSLAVIYYILFHKELN